MAKVAQRLVSVPDIVLPPELPISSRADDIAAALAQHQVIVVAGETGSGKSTQLPKICLQAGRGSRGMIAHTQPRRIAARALAERIADETDTPLGEQIGYAVRFTDRTRESTLVKLMTDGLLLAEIGRDRLLRAYDTIIIDEAHERSLNIDFLLGYLVRILPRRPDLKVIITSATIDPQSFSAHFSGAPIIEVSGRTYPVEIRYRPYGEPDSADLDQIGAICQAVDELTCDGAGDILVFCSGEREITDTAEALRGHLANQRVNTEVLPLYGRLSAAEQHRVFSPHDGRRIILATNVAETSLTVPGITAVIDPGTARISRYSTRSKVQRLPIEPISQASARQRSGRCGRTTDGVCIRLYSEADFAARSEYTDPEILRTSLASVILQMASLDVGDIVDFPFLQAPDTRQITDGIRVLHELGALDSATGPVALTSVGRKIAALPVDPQLARMILEADKRGVLAEVLVIVAGMTVNDVREYPLEQRDAARALHARFEQKTSDFLSYLALWKYLGEKTSALSSSAFRRLLGREYLHYLRVREWQDLHTQLCQLTKELRMVGGARRIGALPEAEPTPTVETGRKPRRGKGSSAFAAAKHYAELAAAAEGSSTKQAKPAEVDVDAVHRSVLAGLLSHIGSRSQRTRDYQGTRGTSFALWPGSALAAAPPSMVMAAELVETGRLWGRTAARIDPAWAEEQGEHLLSRNYSEPRWDGRRGCAVATERVSLLGVTLVSARTVNYQRIDPVASRQLLIRCALVEGDWQTSHRWYHHNVAALERIACLEDRLRRRDVAIDDEALFALYDVRIPASVTSVRELDTWWRKHSRHQPDLLTFTDDELLASAARFSAEEYPDSYSAGEFNLQLGYHFQPGSAEDGVTVTIPLAVLNGVDPGDFAASIPGHRKELAVAMLRCLPKAIRRNFVPAPDWAAAALGDMRDQDGPFPAQLAAALTRLSGVVVGARDFELTALPDHLRMTFSIVDDNQRELARGKDLVALRAKMSGAARQAVSAATRNLERTGLTEFPETAIPRRVTTVVSGHRINGYPALVAETATVGVRVFADADEQRHSMRAATVQLLARTVRSPAPFLRYELSQQELLHIATAQHPSLTAYIDDALVTAMDALLDWAGGPAWDAVGFAALVEKISPHIDRATADVAKAGAQVLAAAGTARSAIEMVHGNEDLVADASEQLSLLVPAGFLQATGAARLPDVQRYLQALARRAERLRSDPERDRLRLGQVAAITEEVAQALAALSPQRRADDDVVQLRWMLQELRVALFAQPIKTAMPISVVRIQTALARLR